MKQHITGIKHFLKLNYRIEDFTVDRFKEFLIDAKSRFVFSAFDNIPDEAHILLRHDLDLSVSAGHEIAIIEHEHGVSATYFVLLHSPFYNLIEAKSYKLIKEILELGHKIGLHFDSHFYNISNEDELDEKISFEKDFINNLFNIDIKVFSFHLTNNFTVKSRNFQYGNLINAFSEMFQTKYEYCSDSFGIWRHKRLFDFMKNTNSNKLQILIHPEWWIHDASMPKDRIKNIIDQKVLELYQDADRNYIYKENL